MLALVGVLVLSGEDVARFLPMKAAIEAMEGAFLALAQGEALLPLRQVVRLPDGSGVLSLMPSHLSSLGVIGAKVFTVFPGNHGTDLDAHLGAVLLFEVERGRLLAVADATSITAIRTAAVSGLATRLLANADAGDLALIGSGTQARTHLEAMLAVRPIRRVRVWSRTPDRASAFAATATARHHLAVEPVPTAAEAVEGADIICTVTASDEPVLHGEWLAPGAHVNAVGSSVPSSREVDAAAVVRARIIVDRRQSALAEAGDLLGPLAEGAIGPEHLVAELAEVLTGAVPGRRSPEEITLFESLGLGIEDLAAAHVSYTRARLNGGGIELDIEGRPWR